jgi:thiol:disulfide interchange protein DsbD
MIEQIQLMLEEAFRQDTLNLYVLMFGGGFIASFTPCMYPVLPLTVGYLGNQAGANRLRVFFLSLSLVTGLAVVYAVLGAIVAAAGGTFGSIMGKGFVLYAIALFYLLMGLFLLDVFRLPNPQFFSWLQAKSADRKGLVGAFVIGGVSGLIVGPCTGPILAVALGSIALTLKDVQGPAYALQVVKGGFLLFLFGFGQGALILIAGMFAGFLARLPKAGAWMETVKKGFALLIILASSLLFVFVGQNTDFPSLTRLLAGPSSPAALAPTPVVPAESRPQAIADPSGNPAPDFTLASLDGSQVMLSSYKGKKGVVLVFFATWCVSCMKEVPEIKRFAEAARKENIEVLAVNYKQQTDIVERFNTSNKVNYGILLDTEGTVTAGKYGIKGLPHIAGIDAKGEVVYRGTELPEDKTEFMAKLKQGL